MITRLNKRKLSQEQDKRVSRGTGLKIQRNSGAVPGKKGDLYGSDLLIETKTRARAQTTFTIKKSWIDKIRQEAFTMAKSVWALVFSFGDQGDFVIIDLDTFQRLCESQQQLEELLK